MKRRALLALLPLPWLGRFLPEARVRNHLAEMVEAARIPGSVAPMFGGEGTSFVCRKPEKVLQLRQNMRIDFYDVPPWWRRLWNRLRPPEPEPPITITGIDHETKTVTFGHPMLDGRPEQDRDL